MALPNSVSSRSRLDPVRLTQRLQTPDICTYDDDVRHMSLVFRLMVSRLADNMQFKRGFLGLSKFIDA